MKNVYLAAWVVICLPACSLSSDSNTEDHQTVKRVPAVKGRSQLEPEEQQAIVRSLAKERNFPALLDMVRGKEDIGVLAADELMRLLPPSNAVAFCEKLSTDDPCWFAAFQNLWRLPKVDSIGYIRTMAQSREGWIRGLCYRCCLQAGWPDLLENAKVDVNCEEMIGFPGQLEDECSVSKIARKYLERVGNQK